MFPGLLHFSILYLSPYFRYWLHFRAVNETTDTLKMSLYLYNFDTVTVHIFQNGQFKEAITVGKQLREHPSKQKRMMIELQQYGYIKKTEGNKKQGYQYEITNYQEYGELQQQINNAMDEVLLKLKGEVVSSPAVVHRNGKPLKTATAKQHRAVVQ